MLRASSYTLDQIIEEVYTMNVPSPQPARLIGFVEV